MIRIGAVNIDTSHPLGFGEALEQMGRAKYVGVYNDSFRGKEEVNGFMRRFGLVKHCDSLEELADMCDIGFIHGCNWDDHLRCAQPFFDRKKPVFIDKPLVGNLEDCRRVEELTANGAIILGCSSVRYCYEIQEYLNRPIEERGETVQLFGTSGVDEFNYGIHIVEAAGALLGTGASWVKYLGRSHADGKYCESYYVQYENGKSFLYNTFTGIWQPFSITVMTTRTTHAFTIDSSRLYTALLEQICNYMEEKPSLLVSVTALLESVKIMLAGSASRAALGRAVMLTELNPTLPSYNGGRFLQDYAASAGAMYATL
ncbi:MAG: Gfo/Idh/MocA family oxidoreductase [Lachnospiraceae bacterium]|jgi:predicted dehydrogenase|nr:Gfo/Idh/MocA family oxidoreductase [Lachnospiraceae bacterium]